MKAVKMTLISCLRKLILLGIILLTWTRLSMAQDTIRQNDPYFPAKHRFSTGILTAYRGPSKPAPALIGEFTYGLTNPLNIYAHLVYTF